MYVGEDLRKKIEEVAEKEERSVSSLARKALKDYIDRLENK
jgi:predicted transcriptional regulator